MKRKARLDYSTSYLPFNSSEPSKKLHTENQQNNKQNQEVDNTQDCNKPFKYIKPQFNKDRFNNENTQNEQTIQDIIKKKLKTNPTKLIHSGKEFQYGNFKCYYDHRYEEQMSDPRLQVLNKEWFFNKDVLDIGCNEGSFTLQVAIKYFPNKIQGIDIDHSLINKAISNCSSLKKQLSFCKDTSEKQEKKDLKQDQRVYKQDRQQNNKQINIFPLTEQIKRIENYVENVETTEKYDTICCFSITKWIQLNFGDEGITRLFQKVYQSLRVNGIFILEPQEWKSYKKKLNFSQELKLILKSIKIRPGDYKQYLQDKYKFILEREIVPEINTDKVPSYFKRVVYVFRKVQ